jgi:hypothetical protein
VGKGVLERVLLFLNLSFCDHKGTAKSLTPLYGYTTVYIWVMYLYIGQVCKSFSLRQKDINIQVLMLSISYVYFPE